VALFRGRFLFLCSIFMDVVARAKTALNKGGFAKMLLAGVVFLLVRTW